MTIHRLLKMPKQSFFLLGPRATGKTTWLRDQIKADLYIDLLKAKDYQKYSTNLSLLSEIIEGNKDIRIIVIDEIQKLPELLDEIHSLIFESKNRLQFILTGSSARKLKKKNVNLLAGRALVRYFHPYSLIEVMDEFNLNKSLRLGMLPQVWNIQNEEDKKDYLTSYVDTYLKEEIQQEAAVRRLPSYLLFLEHLALRNGHILNLQNLSMETGIPRTTINGYLEILEQTMIGYKLSPLQLKAKVKEVSTPKFYFFDTGVARCLAKQIDEDLLDTKGLLLETLVLHELKCFSDYNQKRWEISFWGTPSDNEVDFIVSHGRINIGIEVKSAKTWNASYNKGLKVLQEAGKITKAYGIYTGSDILKKDKVMVLPLVDFVKKLNADELF